MGNFVKFLFFLNFALALSQSCPPKCQCVRNSVRCLHQDLQAIPKTPDDAHTLDVRFNRIYDIAPGVFSHLHRLRSLLLNDNQLRELRSGAFHGLRRLKYLYLYRNRIQHIESDVFHGMVHLEQLYLHVNEIHQIEPETFSNLPRLERLYLHNNNLKTIPPGSFRGMPKLHKLRLDSNALVCDCAMLWFVRMLAEHGDMSIAATCYEPAAATGTSLATMKEKDFHCRRPEIESDPEDVIVNFGEDAMFTCSATGEPEPEIVWFRDSTALPDDKSRYEVMGNGTLMVHKADENDVGVFECSAKNPAGEVRSKPARMIVQSKPDENGYPVFTILPRKLVVKINAASARFDCVAKGNPNPHISWYFNGERILLSERISMQHNGSIIIENIQHEDAGLYTCQAENINGKVTASVNLEVKVAPAFLTVPKDQTIALGDTAQFMCTARGVPKPIITWYKNTMVLPPSENILLRDENQNLTIIEATEDDAGLYHCRAENSEGLTEISAILKVQNFQIVPPKIVLRPEDTDAFKETSVQMPCEYESDPPANVEWRKDGNRVTSNERITIALIGSLIINNVTLTDAGHYECTVFNEYGRDAASLFLTVKDHILPGDEYINIALTEATRDVDQAIAKTIEQLFNNKSSDVNYHDLYRMTRFPNAPAREVARAAEIYERALDKVRQFIQSGLTVTSAQPFNYENILSPQHLEVLGQLSGCVAHRETKDCSDMCYHSKYRSIDGSCNNFDYPTWGTSLTGFRRILFPIYENGFSQPTGWNKNIKYNGYALPSARLISVSIISTTEISEDIEITHMTMQWGQWLDHDLDHALPSVSSQTWDGVDCKKTCDYAAPCFPIDVPENDPRITNRRCIDFVRTSAVCGSGMTSVVFGRLQPREQINQLTSFIDASQVYGFEKSVAEDLRDLTNENGTLRVGAQFPGKKPLLPTTGLNGMDCRRNLEESTRSCFVAGDIRANEQIGLAAMHTIWMREHNRIANKLKTFNPFWDGDKVYQEARKIVGAQMQVITYVHWLPLILGPEGYSQLGEYKEYNPNINPSISNVFATAALRFGHSIINPVLNRYDENFEPIPQGHLLLRNAFFSPWRLVDEGGVDPLLRGMFTTPAKLKTSTQNLNSELTEKLFHTAHAVALDLAAINIQRGRDHAIPPYTKWRQVCNMTEVNDFEDLAHEISDKSVRNKLKELYGSVHNIDVWVGGILEDQVKGGKVGPLFRCLLIEQFRRLRDGDRFWYENPSTFKPQQLKQIKKTNLARVLCDNGDNIDTINENVFLLPEVQDGLISCEDLPSIDLRYWMDCESCGEDTYDTRTNRVRRDLSNDVDALMVEEKHRIDVLEDLIYNEMTNTIEQLKKKILHLEESCQRV
ncbi:peroxidasin-like isoform X1 [Maniola jurtina]|uniref:peroxidasin-like isoform X1 n=2 Tax=Maniola jurtina TaxID=191418 RepID=UPI001E6898C1|nr:peroxidasin-like isoform X1 [Maniola jurtina]